MGARNEPLSANQLPMERGHFAHVGHGRQQVPGCIGLACGCIGFEMPCLAYRQRGQNESLHKHSRCCVHSAHACVHCLRRGVHQISATLGGNHGGKSVIQEEQPGEKALQMTPTMDNGIHDFPKRHRTCMRILLQPRAATPRACKSSARGPSSTRHAATGSAARLHIHTPWRRSSGSALPPA